MKHAHLPAPARIFFKGLTAFSDAYALYPNPKHLPETVYDIALLSLTGPRESVRALQSALISGKRVRALLPGNTLVELRFEGQTYYESERSYGRSFTASKGQALHAVAASKEVVEGRVAFGHSRDEHDRALEQKLAALLPFPTHSLWHGWWLEVLEEQGHLVPLITSRGFFATRIDRDGMHSHTDELLAQLREAIAAGVLEVPTPEVRKEAA